ncbi:MAG TPA: hypothetical protein VNQ90_15805 [Chthoniobacteraceae bacterium]|nr:hypothetical protein [Chthoniobacteraceae bacterium]
MPGETTAPPAWQRLVPLLRCPVNRQPLSLAPQSFADRLDANRKTGPLPCEAAETGRLQINLAEPIEAVLLRSDGQVGYVVQNEVPILLPDHGMRLSAAQTGTIS